MTIRYSRTALMAWLVTLMSGLLLASALLAQESTSKQIWVMSVQGPIGPALSDYLERQLSKADPATVSAAVLQIDTPGGLDTSMRSIIETILASSVPVLGYVAPQGARAASAGTYILYATQIAAMAPATTLGAATPIQISPLPEQGRRNPFEDAGGDEESESTKAHPTLADKAINDAVAYIRALAQLRDRNVEWAELAVTRAASLSADEALSEGVIDLIAENIDDLLTKSDGRVVQVQGSPVTLDTSNVLVVSIDPDWRTELLAIITNPTVAYVLLMVGIYGLVFEFWNPGSIGPGVIGGICLLLGLYALQFLPVNLTGLALIGLGIAFMVAEAFMPSFGVVGLGGLVAFVAGSVMLLDTDAPGFTVSPWVIAALATVGAGVFLTVFTLMNKARHRPVVSGPEEMLDSVGRVIDWKGEQGRVRVHGEIWQAISDDSLSPEMPVRVASRDGLVLTVRKAPDNLTQGQPS